MLEIMQGILIVVIEVICCKIFFDIFLKKRQFKYKVIDQMLIFVLIMSIATCSTFLSQYFCVKQIAVIFTITIVMYIYFNTTILRSFVLSIIYQCILLGIDFLSIIVVKYLLPDGKMDLLNRPAESTLIVLISKMLLFGLAIMIKKKWNYKDSLNMISDYEWIRFLYFPAMTIIAIAAMLINFDAIHSKKESDTLLIIAFGLVIMNIVVFYLIRDIIEREIRLRDDKVSKERMENQTKMYQSISENFELQRKRTHEYKNQIGCIEGMLGEGNIPAAIEYVAGITGGLKKELDAIDTNNVIVNAILNTKYREANEKHIVIALKVNDLSQIVLKDEDIVVVLSNLLNNAIEACEKVFEKRIIRIKFVDEDTLTVLSVKNSMNGNLIKEDNEFKTSKNNKYDHGIGINNICETVQKYGGSYVIKYDKEFFNFSIMIPHIQE